MTSHSVDRTHSKHPAPVQLRASHPPPSSGRCAWQLQSPVLANVLDSSFCCVVVGASLPLCSDSPPPFTCQNFPPLCDFFNFPSFPIPVLALYFVLATWVQPSHPASPRPSSVSGANLVLTHRLLSFLPLSAAVRYCTALYCTVRQFWCHGRWYGRPDLWIQLAVHRQCHRLCRYDHSTPGLLTVSSFTSTVWGPPLYPGREAAEV